MGSTTKSLSELHNLMEVPIDGSSSALRVTGSLDIGGIRALIKVPEHDLSTGAFEYITAQATNFKLKNILLHSDTVILEDLMVYLDDTDNNYDTLIYAKQTSSDGGATGATDLAFYPESEILVYATDGQQLKLTITNVGLTGKIYVSLGIEVLA